MIKKIIVFNAFFVILLVSKMFCIPNDKELYEAFPQIVVSKNFKEVDIVNDYWRDENNVRQNYKTYKPLGVTVKFGKWKHKDAYGDTLYDIDWLVLAKVNGKALLVSRDVLDTNAYNTSGDKCSFDKSTLKVTLNEVFYNNAFSDNEKKYILNYTPTDSKVFVLSEYELDQYLGLNITPNFNSYDTGREQDHVAEAKKGVYTFASYKYKTRSKAGAGNNYDSDSANESYWVRVDEEVSKAKRIVDGKITNKSLNKKEGLRPAIWVSYNEEGQKNYDIGYRKVAQALYTLVSPIERLKDAVGDLDTPLNEIPDEIKDSLTNELKEKAKNELGIDDDSLNALSFDAIYDYANANIVNYTFSGWAADKFYSKSEIVKNKWVKWDKDWFYVNELGEAEKEKWLQKDNGMAYVDKLGKMAKNTWISKKYYVDANGLMLKNTTTPDGYQVDENGERKSSQGNENNFKISLDLNIDIKEKNSDYILYIKSVPKDSDAEKLGLEVNDEIIEINDGSFKENIIIYLEGIYASQGTGKSVTDTAINRFVNAISKSFINMEFENITFKKKNGKIVVLSKEDIEQTLK